MPINIPEALERLCYRYPSPLVDAVTEHEPGHRMVAVKNVSVSEDYFQGHFPGAPVMPGVLMIETLAQVATLLLMHGSEGAHGDRVFLRGVDNAKFRLKVVPGDRLRLEVPILAAGPVQATGHVLTREGEPLAIVVGISERTDKESGQRYLQADATLAPLAQGDYVLEIVAGRESAAYGFRLVP